MQPILKYLLGAFLCMLLNTGFAKPHKEIDLLSFVDMHTSKLVLSDFPRNRKVIIDLKTLPHWPGPVPEHTFLSPDGSKVYVTYIASATEPSGVAVIAIRSIDWPTHTAIVEVVKNLELDKAGTKSQYPAVHQISESQYINPKVEDDWSRPMYSQIHAPTYLPHSNFLYFTMWTDDRILAIDMSKDTWVPPQKFNQFSQQLHGVFFNTEGTVGLGASYYYDMSNIPKFTVNKNTGALKFVSIMHLGSNHTYAPFIHNVFWVDNRYALAGSMQFGATSRTALGNTIIGPSLWLIDTKLNTTKEILGTAKGVDYSGVLRSASWVNVVGSKLFVAEEDSIDSSYGDDGFVSVFDVKDIEHPVFLKRLAPGKELPVKFNIAHSLIASNSGRYVILESYSSGYIIRIDTETYEAVVLASPEEGFHMPHGAWIAGRKD